ncbi:MAG: biotin-dependent carboxyltransferase [Rhodobacteraceae bacterium]|nr:MAG: biotin-dependent carboxyltransferase [Paracoccaceae bacterium]
MTARLRIITPGLQTTVQDAGRVGVQGLGVPASGVLDPPAMRLANALVGNAPDCAVLEMRLTGLAFKVEGAAVRIAVTGAEADVTVQVEGAAPRVFAAWRAVAAPEGALVTISAPRDSAIATVAVSGGIDTPPLWGSRATLLRAGFGGFEGRALRAGDVLPVGPSAEAPLLAAPRPPRDARPARLRVVLGPQADRFTPAARAALVSAPYRVTQDADRMGVRFEGPELTHADSHDIVSDAVLPGSIQAPGSRQPILLLADCQTTGGYPKIATVISADLPRAARLTPGQAARFEIVSVEAGEAAARAADAALAAAVAALAPVVEGAIFDEAALHRENLISGVVGCTE